MPELQALSQFHLLRPWWLLALPLTAYICWQLRRQGTAEREWGRVIAPHLLAHVTVGREQRARLRPANLLGAVLALAAIAMAGPSWRREPSPFTENQAPLAIALSLASTMNAVDLQPTRLERAKQKIRDLLALRQGARTGLLVYAGSAHAVLPLTDDPQILELYLESLDTAMMPVAGDDPALALALAAEMLDEETLPGAVLFVADGMPGEREPFAAYTRESRNALLVLGLGTSRGGPIRIDEHRFATDAEGHRTVSRLDREALEAFAGETGASVTTATVDDSDLRRLDRRIHGHWVALQSEDGSLRWRDDGYILVLPLAALAVFWFRRGWTIRWAAALLLLLALPGPAGAQGSSFANLWLTPDQQARWLFERGRLAEAAQRFEDPMWKGIAFYAAQDFESAVTWFAQLETPEAYFNLGNAQAQAGELREAIRAYDRALELSPRWTEAQENRAYVETLIPAKVEPPADDHGGTGGMLGADEVVLDETGERTQDAEQTAEVAGGELSNEQISELWMRRVQTTPADFLSQKFDYQLRAQEGLPASEGASP